MDGVFLDECDAGRLERLLNPMQRSGSAGECAAGRLDPLDDAGLASERQDSSCWSAQADDDERAARKPVPRMPRSGGRGRKVGLVLLVAAMQRFRPTGELAAVGVSRAFPTAPASPPRDRSR